MRILVPLVPPGTLKVAQLFKKSSYKVVIKVDIDFLLLFPPKTALFFVAFGKYG